MRSASTGSTAGPLLSVCCDALRAGRRANAENGFTLIEALVALTVLALALAAFSPSFGAAARNFVRLEDRLAAQLLATSLLDEQTAARVLLPGVTRGRHGSYSWQVVVALAAEDVSPAIANPWSLFELVVVVDWLPQRRLQLQTLHLGKLQ